jgi:hypothetical protein
LLVCLLACLLCLFALLGWVEQFVPEKRLPPHRIQGYSASKRWFMFGLAHSLKTLGYWFNEEKNKCASFRKNQTHVHNSGKKQLKQLWGQTSWVGSGFDHSGHEGAGGGRLAWSPATPATSPTSTCTEQTHTHWRQTVVQCVDFPAPTLPCFNQLWQRRESPLC